MITTKVPLEWGPRACPQCGTLPQASTVFDHTRSGLEQVYVLKCACQCISIPVADPNYKRRLVRLYTRFYGVSYFAREIKRRWNRKAAVAKRRALYS